MVIQIALGCAMIVVTMMCHGLLTGYSLGALKRRYEARGAPRTDLAAALVVAMFVLWLFMVTVASILAWTLLLVMLSVFPAFEEALYFSTVTMTTVGYGDVVVARQWRLLAGIQAVNGSFLFGWSTALVFSVVEATYRIRGGTRSARAKD